MNIEWYPGHIAKARREIKEHIKEVDLVIEIVDARCIMSSINFLNEEIKNKKRLIVVNKIDLADENELKKINREKIKTFIKDFDGEIIFLDSRNNNIKKDVDKKIDKLTKEIVEKKKAAAARIAAIKARRTLPQPEDNSEERKIEPHQELKVNAAPLRPLPEKTKKNEEAGNKKKHFAKKKKRIKKTPNP